MPVTISRRSFGALGAAALAAAPRAASAADTWRLSSMMPADSAEGRGYTKFSELAQQYSGGNMSVRVYPSEQLGKIEAVIEQVKAGITHVAPSSAAFLSRWAPEMRYISAPFLFDDYDHWGRFMRTDLVKGWLRKVEETAGITVIGDITAFPRGTFRVLVSKRPVRTLEDLRGLKVRQFSEEIVVAAWRHLGAEVRVMAWNEVYDGLNRGIIEGVTSPAELVESMRFYEVAKYVVRTDEYPQGVAFMTNARAFRALGADSRNALQRAHAEASAFEVNLLRTSLTASLDRVKQRGGVYAENIDKQGFVGRMRDFYRAREQAGQLPAGFLAAVEASRRA